MRNKEVEDRIRKSIDIESRDFLDKLLEYPVEKRRKKSKLKYIKWGVNFGSVCVFIFALFLTKNMWNRDQKLSPTEPPSIVDHIQFNKVEYNNGVSSDDTPVDNKNQFGQIKNLLFINTEFNLNIQDKMFEQYEQIILCYLVKDTNEVSYCNITLSKQNSDSMFQIGIKKNEFPIFNGESVDMWKKQNNFSNYHTSQIHSKEIVLLEDSPSEFKRYKTKFKINDLGIAVDSYEIEEEAFIDMIKVIIDNFK